jgi:hypothetical protein
MRARWVPITLHPRSKLQARERTENIKLLVQDKPETITCLEFDQILMADDQGQRSWVLGDIECIDQSVGKGIALTLYTFRELEVDKIRKLLERLPLEGDS